MKRLLFFIILFFLLFIFYYCRSESILFEKVSDIDKSDISIIIDIQKIDTADKDFSGVDDLYDSGSDVEDSGCKLKPLSGVVQISAGAAHTCALMEYGGVKCWGGNFEGQIGDGTKENRLMPVDLAELSSDVNKISASDSIHSCALSETGGVKCWGNNKYGQLGDGTTENRLTPVDVIGLSSDVIDIDVGDEHTCALMKNSNVMCWGNNRSGQLGDGTFGNKRLSPVDVTGLNSDVQKISTGGLHTCALMKDGSVKCWGNNGSGQLGDGTYNNIKSTPVDVHGLPTKVKDISAGAFHTCAVLIDGKVMCWGSNLDWQLGDGNYDEEYRTTPVYVTGLDTEAVQVSAGGDHTCALLKGGSIRCWGRGLEGQLGNGRVGGSPWPVTVIGISNAIEVSVGASHTCALLEGGTVKCWGENGHGQLGNGTTKTWGLPLDVMVCE